MGEPARFAEDLILDAALRVVADGGPPAATIAAIADELGAPIGSIYHHFRSRDQVLAHLWIRTVRRFQEGFVRVLQTGPVEEVPLFVTRWCREHLPEARVLVLFRREDLAVSWPDDLGKALATLEDPVEAAVAGAARRRYGVADARSTGRIVFAVIDLPYAVVRRHLAEGERCRHRRSTSTSSRPPARCSDFMDP